MPLQQICQNSCDQRVWPCGLLALNPTPSQMLVVISRVYMCGLRCQNPIGCGIFSGKVVQPSHFLCKILFFWFYFILFSKACLS